MDFTFRDLREVSLKLSDRESGQVWFIPTPTVTERITYEARGETRTGDVDVGARLDRRFVEPIVTDLARRLRAHGRAITDDGARIVLEEGLRTYFLRGGAMLKFIPEFRVEWV
jgi:hypothetical protein